MTVIDLMLAILGARAFNAVMYQVAKYVEDHTNFTTGHTRLKERLSGALWWLA